jgi:hypothetical protein
MIEAGEAIILDEVGGAIWAAFFLPAIWQRRSMRPCIERQSAHRMKVESKLDGFRVISQHIRRITAPSIFFEDVFPCQLSSAST